MIKKLARRFLIRFWWHTCTYRNAIAFFFFLERMRDALEQLVSSFWGPATSTDGVTNKK
jgi:hypothetical protein